MQRARKVRVWDSMQEKMIYDAPGLEDYQGWTYLDADGVPQMCIPMDWTGRQDCEETDIYEGDRLAWGERPAGMVYWNTERSAWYVWQFANQIAVSLEVFLSGKLPFRVFGNIFEGFPKAK